MPHQLNANLETLFLLMNTPWSSHIDEAIRQLEETGVDGAAFYAQNGEVIDRYYGAFEQAHIPSPGAALLAGAEDLLVTLLLDLLWHHPEWVADIDAVPDEALAEAVNGAVASAVGDEADIFTGLEALGVPDQDKWQAMLLLQKPRQQLGAVLGAVRQNLPAFEAARAAVAEALGPLMAQFAELAVSTYGSWPLDLSRVIGPSAPIIPMLAEPFAILYTDDACLCGLLCHRLFRSVKGELTRDELLVCAKSLSDKSKLEILLCLKEESLYGLEIAEKVGLTPATVSHHMGILLGTGFVELEKRGGKAYYRLSKIGVQKFLSGAEQLLL